MKPILSPLNWLMFGASGRKRLREARKRQCVRGRRHGLEVLEARWCFSSVPFEPALGSPIPVGDSLNAVAVGDFNSDGKPDLATCGNDIRGNFVRILLGDGTGAFTAAGDLGVGSNAFSVAIGDFNSDGKQDLATANLGSNDVSILLGDGTGAFTFVDFNGVGKEPVAVAVGDFNSDGKQDLATANQNSANVSILLGDGTGGFTPAVPYGVGDTPSTVVVGDFNSDGKQDLATANLGSNDVSILLGDGTGAFPAPGAVVDHAGAVRLAVGDFNGDGNQDLAAANYEEDNVSILSGDGTGAFTPTSVHGVGDSPTSVAVGDFNVDGILDLATANSTSHDVSILLSNGTGAFTAAGVHGVGQFPGQVAVGDFNGDGSLDLATANIVSGDVSILLNKLVQISVNDVALLEGDAGTNNLVFNVSLSQSSANTITLDFATLNATATAGIDYQNTFGTISFQPGQTSRFIVVPVNGDRRSERDETFTLLIGNASEGAILRNSAIGTILNDDGGGGKGGGKKSAAYNANDLSIELLAESIVIEQEALSRVSARRRAPTLRSISKAW